MFAFSELDFLGHCISAAGVTPLRDNLQVILDFPKPSDCKALQRFFGMMNFYRRFLPGVTGTLRTLTAALSGNPKALPWTPDMETAFAAAKVALVIMVPLAHPLPGAVLALATAASDTPVGVVLEQQVGQHWQPLGFFSKKLYKTEVNYSSFDQELLATVSGIKHFRSRLEGGPFQLWTDHKPLIFALNRVSPPTSGRQQRHLAFISEYTKQLVYVPGKANVVADMLSRPAAAAAGSAQRRLPLGPPGSAQPSPTSLLWISMIWQSARSSAHRYRLSVPVQVCASSHKRSVALTSSAIPPLASSARWYPEICTVRFSSTATGPPILAGGRPAASSPPGMFGRFSPQMSQPGLPAGQGPPPCTGTPATHPGTHPPFQPHHVDLVGPLPASKGFAYLFTINEKTSRWPEAIPIAATSTVNFTNALFQGWVSGFGVPAVITSDCGAQFTSSLGAALCSLLNIQHNQTTAYHLQSNVMVAPFHHRLKDALHAVCAAANWVNHLPWVLLGLRAAAREDDGSTPAQAVFG